MLNNAVHNCATSLLQAPLVVFCDICKVYILYIFCIYNNYIYRPIIYIIYIMQSYMLYVGPKGLCKEFSLSENPRLLWKWVGGSRSHSELFSYHDLGAIQVLRNADGGGVSTFPGKSVTKVYGPTLLALRGGGWGSNIQTKSVT